MGNFLKQKKCHQRLSGHFGELKIGHQRLSGSSGTQKIGHQRLMGHFWTPRKCHQRLSGHLAESRIGQQRLSGFSWESGIGHQRMIGNLGELCGQRFRLAAWPRPRRRRMPRLRAKKGKGLSDRRCLSSLAEEGSRLRNLRDVFLGVNLFSCQKIPTRNLWSRRASGGVVFQ
jgi:hypothetical protein